MILGVYDPARVEEDLDIRFEGLLGQGRELHRGRPFPDGEAEAAYRNHGPGGDGPYRLGPVLPRHPGEGHWLSHLVALFSGRGSRTRTFRGGSRSSSERTWPCTPTTSPLSTAWLREYHDLRDFTPTQRKMEWQAGTAIESVWQGVIQFRPSGVRIQAAHHLSGPWWPSSRSRWWGRRRPAAHRAGGGPAPEFPGGVYPQPQRRPGL